MVPGMCLAPGWESGVKKDIKGLDVVAVKKFATVRVFIISRER